MKILQRLKEVVRTHLFASIDAPYAEKFKMHLYRINNQRFLVQCFILTIMDVCTLLFHVVTSWVIGQFFVANLMVYTFKITFTVCGIFYFYTQQQKPYTPHSVLHRNMQTIYPALHFIAEFALFATGAQGFGALIRLMAVPFVVGTVPVVPRQRSFILLVGVYMLYTVYLYKFSVYSQYINILGYLLNMWLVVFVCALWLAFNIYSSFVNWYTARCKEADALQELEVKNKQLQEISRRDYLTGFLNRWGLEEYLTEMRPHITEQTVAALVLDLDHFKKYNDRFGRAAADACLIKIAKCLRAGVANESAVLTRFDGEEFLLLLYGRPHKEMVQLAETLRKEVLSLKIENPDSDTSPYLTITAGVATRHGVTKHEEYKQLVRQANQCLRMAKRAGRNRVMHSPPEQVDFYDIANARYNPAPDIEKLNRNIDAEHLKLALKDVSLDCTFIYMAETGELSFSRAATRAFALPAKLANVTLEKTVEYLPMMPKEKEEFIALVSNKLYKKRPAVTHRLHLQTRGQTYVPVSVRIQFVYSPKGQLQVAQGFIINISSIVEYSHFLKEQNMRSAVTQLPNRKKLRLDIQALVQQNNAKGYGIFLDIVNFRRINGFYSHNIGDKVLVETAKHLLKLAPHNATVYNYNIDQFVLLLNQATEAEVVELMQEIHQYFHKNLVLVENLDLQVDFVMIAVGYKAGDEPNDLMVDLDIAIQIAKENREVPFSVFSSRQKTQFLQQATLTNNIKKAVENNFEGFTLHYQPILSLKKEVLGAEALLRWKNQQGEVASPVVVIPVLERLGLIKQVEGWIINTACAQCASWLGSGVREDFFIHINFSAVGLERSTLISELNMAVQKNGLKQANIIVEVTESYSLLERKTNIDTLRVLREEGYKIAIDDFGSGYSSLQYLNTLPIDEVKVDRSFVQNIEKNESARNFLSSIVSMAQNKGFLVCVEGVETNWQYNFLRTLKVDFLQGFLFGKPLPPAELFNKFLQS